MVVRFATICDHDSCLARSPEYTMWPTCRTCGGDICPLHMWPGTYRPADLDTRDSVICTTCEDLSADETILKPEPPACLPGAAFAEAETQEDLAHILRSNN